MASKKKEKIEIKEEEIQDVKTEEVVITPKSAPAKEKTIEPKAKVGDIVFISRDADTDLEGFKLFPQYKKYTYTVEDYNQNTDVYSLRRANLLLRLKGECILRPEEKAHDHINRIQF